MVAGFASIYFLYYLAYEGFHFLMHKPSIAWIERSRAFRFLDRHHRIHHSQMGTNFNVVLPLADLVLGTLVLRDPLAPRVTEPAARRTARRHSNYGKRLREQGLDPDARPSATPGEATAEAVGAGEGR